MKFDNMTDSAIKIIMYLLIEQENKTFEEIHRVIPTRKSFLLSVINILVKANVLEKNNLNYYLLKEAEEISIYDLVILLEGSINILDDINHSREVKQFIYKCYIDRFYNEIDKFLKVNMQNTTIKDMISNKK